MIFSLLSGIRWQDITDITLTSYILFRFYVLFRGTNVFRVIGGIALLWFFQRVAVFLGLIVTSWVMQGFTAVRRPDHHRCFQKRDSQRASGTKFESYPVGVYPKAGEYAGGDHRFKAFTNFPATASAR